MDRDQLQKTLSAYDIERELGGGGMSQVFLAVERALGRHIVVKLLSEELASGVSADRFKREIQVVAQLQHPNIVPLLAAGDAGGLPYYTMPFVEGESLRARLGRTGELTVAEALRLLRDIARALDYAHQHGVIHRDIKPDNVLVSGDYALVTDFGVGKALTAARNPAEATITNFGVAVGTPAYMAPEQAAGDTVDHRADIYAFGCVAYEMLTGHPPFSGRSAQELLAAHITAVPTPVREKRPTVPDALAALVMRCLEKRPADRPQSSAELIHALDAVVTPATGTGIGAAVRQPPARRRNIALGLAASLLLIVAAAAVVTRRSPSQAVDQSLVTVLPFRVSAADASMRYLREGMMDLVAAKLTGGYRAVDPRTVLAAWRREGGSDAVDLPERQGLDVARALTSARLLQGEIVGSSGQLTISGTLLDVIRGTPRANARVQGDAAALAVLVDSLVAKLLVLDSGGDEQQSVALAGTPFSALQAYLAGQRLYRAGRYAEANDEFAKALGLDSTFAQAALGLVLGGGWTLDQRSPRALGIVRSYRDRLSSRDQLLLDVVVGPARPRTCRERLSQQESAVERAADLPDLWYALGDNLLHCGEAMGMRDAWTRSLGAFEKALAIDSGFTSAWEHVPGILMVQGDTARARVAFAAYARDKPDLEVPWRFLLFADSAERERLIPEVAANRSMYFGLFGGVLGPLIEPRQIRLSERVLDMLRRRAVTEAERQQVLDAELKLALNRGQPARAARIARQHTSYSTARRLLDNVFHDGDSAVAAEAMVLATRALGTEPASPQRAEWIATIFAGGVYEAAQGRSEATAKAAAALRALRAPADSPWVADAARRAALLLDAQYAVMTGNPNATRTLADADSMMREGPPGVLTRAAGNLLVARMWEQLGDVQRAYDAVRRLYHEPTFPPFFTTYKRERARLATLTGDNEDAIKMYRKYLAIRYEPEPALRGHVESVRRELQRLERVSAGR